MKKLIAWFLLHKNVICVVRFVPLVAPVAATILVGASANVVSSAGASGQTMGGSDSGATPAAGPLTLVVNTLGDAADTNVGDGLCDTDAGTSGDQCTLRAAIQETNAATAGTDVISFSLPAGSVITLESALDALNGNVTIAGAGAGNLTIQRNPAAPSFRVFTTIGFLTVKISGMTIIGGRSTPTDEDGGAIFNQNSTTLTLTNVRLSGNATSDASLFRAGFGGAIFNDGVLNLISTTVSGNVTGKGIFAGPSNGGDGGGIYNAGHGTLNIINSSIIGNATGNGVSNSSANDRDGNGGGIFNSSSGGPVNIINSTISDNTTGTGGSPVSGGQGGGIISSGMLMLSNCTVTNNAAGNFGSGSSGGISTGGSPALIRNTIVANNTAASFPDLNGLFNSQDYNLIKNTSGATFIGTTTHNIVGQDPNLGPLANNGGPTQTRALLTGSPALDAGNNTNLPSDTFDLDADGDTAEPIPFDQRGAIFKRVVDGPDADSIATVDIGAFEAQTTNPLDDPESFVREHYLDFLNRQPDSSGLAFWISNITNCGANQQCIDVARINVSGAFFLSIEFQQTGYLVERIYKAAFGNASGTSTLGGTHQLAVPIVRLNEFLPDTQEIGQGVIVNQGNWQQQLENNKLGFTTEFVQRSRFTTAFPASMTPAQFVDTLNTNAGNPLSPAERNQLVTDLSTNAKTRAQVLRAVAEDPDLIGAEFNRAFVLMQFFGYLRRNPNDPQDTDYTGYDFWLTKLTQFNGNFQNAEMVKAFISSLEYRQRFGP